MVNQGTFGEDLTPAIDALKRLKEYGESKNVSVILEPRGKSTTEVLLKVIHDAGIYANPDIGNFRDEEGTERGLRLLYPLAKTVSHVKWDPERFDFAKAIQILRRWASRGCIRSKAAGLNLTPVYKHFWIV